MKIILAEDDIALRKGITAFLHSLNHEVEAVGDGTRVLKLLESTACDLIISDLKMPEMDGMSLLLAVKEKYKFIPVVIMTAFASVENAVEAMKQGAADYLTKPVNLEELKLKTEKIQQSIQLRSENQKLKERLNRLELPEIVGNDRQMVEVKKKISKLSAGFDIPVMIYGESGTGKELVAKTIHSSSQRRRNPFVAINCAAIPEELLESELFGYCKGAFTGAFQDKQGLFAAAGNGTLFLDEVSEMSGRMQAKLLRVLQEKQVIPLGTTRAICLTARILGASNRNLLKLVKENKFREDLYYRLNVAEIFLPPLRERQSDIPLLINHFIVKEDFPDEKKLIISKPAMKLLQNYGWPGNIREIENLIKTLAVSVDSYIIKADDLPEKILQNSLTNFVDEKKLFDNKNFHQAVERAGRIFEKKYIEYFLRKNNNNISQTAAEIKLSRVSLHKKIKQFKILTD